MNVATHQVELASFHWLVLPGSPVILSANLPYYNTPHLKTCCFISFGSFHLIGSASYRDTDKKEFDEIPSLQVGVISGSDNVKQYIATLLATLQFIDIPLGLSQNQFQTVDPLLNTAALSAISHT